MRVEGRISRLVEDCYKSKIINRGRGDALPSIPEVLGLSRGDILVPTPVENSPAKSSA
ncbi:MAG: hypothetical protein M3P08_11985 [Thermoproteota archaeon]|nr:hypothetical protein [Thermoproteota archaeon]